MDNETGFLLAVLALALVATLEGEEKPKSARRNRCSNAHDAILKVCDIYLPEGMDKAKLTDIFNVLDGPVMQVIAAHREPLFGAVREVYKCQT
jgi:hypothetical protein